MSKFDHATPSKRNLMLYFEVSDDGYKTLKTALLDHASILTSILSPEPEQPDVSAAEVFLRICHRCIGISTYEHQVIVLELAQGGGITIAELGLYAYLSNDHFLSQAFREISASDERIVVSIAAQNIGMPERFFGDVLEKEFQLEVITIPERSTMEQKVWESLIETATAQAIEKITIFAEKECLVSNILGY